MPGSTPCTSGLSGTITRRYCSVAWSNILLGYSEGALVLASGACTASISRSSVGSASRGAAASSSPPATSEG